MRAFSAIVLILFGQSLFAQDVNWGAEYKKARSTSNLTHILGDDDEFIYAVMTTDVVEQVDAEKEQSAQSQNRDRMSLVKFDQSLNLKKEVPLEPRLGKKRMAFQFAEKVGDSFFSFSSIIDRKERKNVLMAHEIDTKTLKLKKNPIEIGSTNVRNSRNVGAFAYELSRKRSKFLAVGYEPSKRGDSEKFNLFVFDNNLEPQWEKEITIPYRDELFFIERFMVDDRGDVYVLGKHYFDRPKTRRRGKPNYQYVILAYRYQGLEFEQYEIKLRDKFITDLSFTVDDKGDLICAGFFSERGGVSVKGTYFMSIDAITQEIQEEGFKDFEEDFLTQFMNGRQAARGRELFDYKLEEIILRADGGAILIAEQYFVEIVTYNDGTGVNRTQYYYNYNDIIVVNINPDKSIEWAAKVPKRQVTVNDFGYFSSFVHAITNQNIYLVYNDNARNLERNGRRTPLGFNGNRSVVMLVSIDPEGNVKREVLTSNREEGIITRPKSCEQLNIDRLVIYGSRGKKYKLGEVILD